MRPRHTARGFSLIELVLVVVIVAMVAGVGIARAGSGAAAYRAALAAKRIASDMELARRQSFLRATTVSMAFDVINNRYTITGLYADGETTVVDLSLPPYRVGLAAVSLDGATTLEYDAGLASTTASLAVSLDSDAKTFDATISTVGDTLTSETALVTELAPGG